jgi:DNA-binding beta-propeller fold protein YncE
VVTFHPGGGGESITFPVAVKGLAFDGTYLWVTSGHNGGSVIKTDRVTGAQTTFSVGANPIGIAFDGTNIWVTNNGGASVTKLRASDGACVSPCTIPVGLNPSGLAFDGTHIWVANTGSNTVSKR